MVKNQPAMWEMHETWEILWTEEPHTQTGFPGGSVGKESLGEVHGYQFQYSCLENSMDRENWQATVHRLSQT